MKFAVCGEYESMNYGDGVIGIALEQLVQSCFPESEVHSFDLSKRKKGSASNARACETGKRTFLKRVHLKLYTNSRTYASLINYVMINLAGYREFFMEQLSGRDILVIGGGQLFMDSRLSFPLKIYLLLKVVAKLDIPVVFFSIGVGSRWSSWSKYYFGKVIKSDNVHSIYCRDEESYLKLVSWFPECADKLYRTVDVALFLGNSRRPDFFKKNQVALGVISPMDVQRVSPGHVLSDRDRAKKFWIELYSALCDKYGAVTLFTNGSIEDGVFLEELVSDLGEIEKLYKVDYYIPTSKNLLVDFISSSNLVIAARMHASIIAFSMGIPCVAIEWDEKIWSFMKYVGREEFCARPEFISIELIISMIENDEIYDALSCEFFRDKLMHDFCRSLPSGYREVC
ncbi:polysaccharide pyruvyl transferase family protein [Idiomarina abyssalis]|uniref:polysaccharide pyruvyl transferase family protein n=1 Tax=Idiomarina abyssalis TaxID=86102 RepID=UPI003A8D37AD